MDSQKQKESIEKMLGRLFISKWDKNEFDGQLVQLIQTYHISGFFFADNVWQHEKNVAHFTRYSQYYAGVNNPLLIAMTIPTNKNSSLQQITHMPTQKELGTINHRLYTRQIAEVCAEQHRNLGVNLFIGPSLESSSTSECTFSENYDLIAKHGVASIQGFHKGRIACAVTGITTDKNLGRRVDSQKSPLYPYYQAAKANADVFFISNLDQELIKGTIESDLQFNGVIAYETNRAFTDVETIVHEVIRALNCGVHLIVLPYDYKQQITVLNRLIEMGKRGELNKDTIVYAGKKIDELKRMYSKNHLASFPSLHFKTRFAKRTESKIIEKLTNE